MKTEDILQKILKIAKEEEEKEKTLQTVLSLVADDIYYQNLDISFYTVNPSTYEHVACAIDGSTYKVDIEDTTLIISRAVKVKGFYKGKKEIPPEVIEDLKLVSNYYGADKINKDAVLSMLTLETNMLKSCLECDVIFIDGPIIDPPIYDEKDEELKLFVEYRLNTLKSIQDKSIIGVVKRFSQRFLINYLIKNGYFQLKDARESYMVSLIFKMLREKYDDLRQPRFLGWIDWSSFLSTSSLDDLKGLLKAYSIYREHGIEIFSGYYQHDAASPIVRIDVTKPDLSLLSYVKTWSYPQIEEVIVLNKLADEISNIKKTEAEAYAKLLVMAREKMMRNGRPDI